MLSKLDAINEILTASGEQAIQVLVSGAADSANAEAILNQETKKVLAKGWLFNTENNVEMVRDGTGRIVLTADILRIDPTDQSLNYTQRGGKLYDLNKRTDIFTESVYCNLIRLLDFEDVPYDVQNLIVARAKKAYQRAYVGSQTLDAFNREDLADAQAVAADSDAEDSDLSILNNPAFAGYIPRRYRGSGGRTV